MPVLAFDVYGTLVDVHAIREITEPFLGTRSSSFLVRWREKTVEYAFRRGLMQNYVEFRECSRQALDYADLEWKAGLTDQAKQTLLAAQLRLPAFSDAITAMPLLTNPKNWCVAFSNGTRAAVESVLSFANLIRYFSEIISVDDLRTFKPSPAVYAYLARRVSAHTESVWLISSNGWDVIGAKSAGLRAIWVRRHPDQVLDPWGIEPDAIATDLMDCTRLFD